MASGDEEAVGLLYNRLGRSVYALCLRIVYGLDYTEPANAERLRT